MAQGSILVVDDSQEIQEVYSRILKPSGYRISSAYTVPEAYQLLERQHFDLVLTDLKMPGASGMELVRYVNRNFQDLAVVMITGYASIEGAVEAVQSGADGYLVKPVTREELLSMVEGMMESLLERQSLWQKLRATSPESGLIGESPAMQRLIHHIAKAASTSATVLITGESGTGKELVARAIHYNSPHSKAPFIPVSCAAIPEGLLESELFGSTKGAFTGAEASRAGFFEAASGGTLLLDEIGETTLATQVRLLRVLQDCVIYRVGSTQPIKLDVRIIAATNKDLADQIAKGAFRSDLFYRINVLPIALPPLRDRGDDLYLLIEHFSRQASLEAGRPAPRFSPEVVLALADYDWPGNVRELENLVKRMVIMSSGDEIGIGDLPSLFRTSRRDPEVNRTLLEVEIDHIQRVLASVGGNKTQAAAILGIDRKTLREKLRSRSPKT